MVEKEVAELRRRFRPDRGDINTVRGCYVNEKHEIVSEFRETLSLISQGEAEQILALLKKVLTGTLGKNLLDITFSTQQVMDSEEHKLLMDLRTCELKDSECLQRLYTKITQELCIEGSYMILLAYDAYDVPFRSQNDEVQADSSDETFSYIICAVCPMKMTKQELGYYASENKFRSIAADWVISPTELGFVFPAFDGRSTNIYNALYYTRDASENHPEFVNTVFHSEILMPATAQKETFQSILGDTVAEDCSLEVVQAVHEQLSDMVEVNKANKEEEPLRVTKDTVKKVLESCGVSRPHVEAFEEKYDAEFGSETQLSPVNVVDTRQLEVRMPDVTIHVNPERSDLLQTRVLDGARYILIRAEEGVEVNGVNICIPKPGMDNGVSSGGLDGDAIPASGEAAEPDLGEEDFRPEEE